MTGHPRANDRGRQPDRTVLAWSRTSLAAAVAGGLLLSRGRDVAGLVEHPGRLMLGGVAATVAAVVLLIGVRRRRALAVRPAASADRGRMEVIVAGAAILVLSGLVLTHLLMLLLD